MSMIVRKSEMEMRWVICLCFWIRSGRGIVEGKREEDKLVLG